MHFYLKLEFAMPYIALMKLSACEWCYYFLQMHEIFLKANIGKFYYYL